jgi:ABC-type nickel/cobalt efflux system permease component RcnA
MRTSGWIFMAVSWSLVTLVTVWCLIRVVTSRQHWQEPDQDIERLHHGEFSGEDREDTPTHPRPDDGARSRETKTPRGRPG